MPRAAAPDGDHRRHDRRGGRRKFFRRSNALPHVRVFLYFSSSSNSIASANTKGGEGLIPEPTDMPVQPHNLPNSHLPRPTRPGSRASIALRRDRRGHFARPTRPTPWSYANRLTHTRANPRTHTRLHLGA